MSGDLRYDLVFVGGGLANTLAAYRCKTARPSLRMALLERAGRLGGQHTWSFHSSDLDPAERAWLQPFVTHSWPCQEVRFPDHTRVLDVGYNSITSERLHAVVLETLADAVRLDCDVKEIAPRHVVLAGGGRLEADCVIDGRGMVGDAPLALGYQKFVGLEVRLAAPHGARWPIIMDATVPQRDGYRFVYTLPFTEDRILIEDTYYSDTAALDVGRIRDEIGVYARGRGWAIEEVCSAEQGVLPIVLAGDIEAHWEDEAVGVPRAGLRALMFHQTTSYSLPDAVALADRLSREPSFEAERIAALTRELSHRRWAEQGFYRLLNRMLFLAAAPEERYRVLQRFYRLPTDLIQRFYAGRLGWADQARILAGRPPVPVSRALTSLGEAAAWDFFRDRQGRSRPVSRAAGRPVEGSTSHG